MQAITIDRDWDPNDPHPLYHRPDGASSPWYAEIRLDLRTIPAVLTATARPPGGIPIEIWRRRVLNWHVMRPEISAQALDDLLGQIAPLAEQIVHGYTVEHDANGNPIGALDDDATRADNAIAELLYEVDAMAETPLCPVHCPTCYDGCREHEPADCVP